MLSQNVLTLSLMEVVAIARVLVWPLLKPWENGNEGEGPQLDFPDISTF